MTIRKLLIAAIVAGAAVMTAPAPSPFHTYFLYSGWYIPTKSSFKLTPSLWYASPDFAANFHCPQQSDSTICVTPGPGPLSSTKWIDGTNAGLLDRALARYSEKRPDPFLSLIRE